LSAASFYTGTIGSGAISPVLYCVLGDWVGAFRAAAATAMVALAIYPLAFALAPHLSAVRALQGMPRANDEAAGQVVKINAQG
jgi:hypothetical protein